MQNLKFLIIIFNFILLPFIFLGCATVPSDIEAPAVSKVAAPRDGIYHRVQKGQTLWRISKAYGVDMDDLVQLNHLPQASNIEIGQLIFIPNAKSEVSVGPAVNSSKADDFIWPLRGTVISKFGEMSNGSLNKGIDISSPVGREVYAAQDGTVVFYSDEFKNFGKTVIIQHDGVFSTVYARNSNVLVNAGDVVKKGSCIAKVGTSGRDRDSYLHFEIRKKHVAKNPYYFLP